MEWFADFARVSFGGIEKVFDVSSVFCEFNLGGNFIQIKWYGVIIAFGFILAALFGGRIAYTWRMDLSKMIDVLIYGTFGGIIGARAYYVIFEWDYYRLNPAEIFQIWNGGLAIYGGIIGGLIAAFITCKIEKLNFMNLLDLVGMSLLIGQGIGRWGNYANQEAFGTFTNGNYGMMSKKVAAYVAMNPDKFGLEGVYDIPEYIAENNLYVHPTFFYEFVWCMVGFGLLYLCLKKFRKFSGQLFLSYGVWYGLGRMFIEGLRTDSLYIGSTGIRVSQLLSAAIVLVCGVILVGMLIKVKKHPVKIEGVDYFPADAAKTLKERRAEKQKNLPNKSTFTKKKRIKKMAEIICGKTVSAAKRLDIKNRVEELKNKGVTTGLAVIIVGNNSASRVYVNNKKKACEEVGIESFEFALPEETTQEELLNLIDKLNNDSKVDGILCQLPLPSHIDEQAVINSIDPKKDVDAFHPENVGHIMIGDYTFLPCTPAGIMEMLKFYNIDVKGKKCVVIGRSNIVGKPMAMLLLKENGTVEICHSRTENLKEETLTADILVAAVGKAYFVTEDMVKEGAVVIDVGMNRNDEGKLCGDVDFDNVKEKASFITPVPGGVGPMTITMLLENTVRAASQK